jgi:D-beta-D-heptose 7-phosphate kinase/D-beta-D-heptose 1-phosphate adenosyltransferase
MRNSISVKRSSSLFAKGQSRKIAVVGDVMLDQFVWGRVSRISPEAPVPVVEVTRESYHLGGGANVAHNLYRLGAAPWLIGARGDDDAARRLTETLAETGISEVSLIQDPNRPTTVKTRIIAHNQQVVRTDWESRNDLPRRIETRLLREVEEALKHCSAVILSDYSKGTLTTRILESSIALARKKRVPVLVDPKLKRFSAYRGARLITPNAHEAEGATGIPLDDAAQVEKAAKKILNLLRCQGVLITRGEQGMSLFEKARRPVHIGASAREVFDVTGAGDTVIATAAFVIAAGGNLKEAAVLANRAAGIVVGKLGTATTTPEEVLATFG